MTAHDPVVVPYADVADRWVVRCPCGLMETYGSEQDAHARAEQHRQESS